MTSHSKRKADTLLSDKLSRTYFYTFVLLLLDFLLNEFLGLDETGDWAGITPTQNVLGEDTELVLVTRCKSTDSHGCKPNKNKRSSSSTIQCHQI